MSQPVNLEMLVVTVLNNDYYVNIYTNQ